MNTFHLIISNKLLIIYKFILLYQNLSSNVICNERSDCLDSCSELFYLLKKQALNHNGLNNGSMFSPFPPWLATYSSYIYSQDSWHSDKCIKLPQFSWLMDRFIYSRRLTTSSAILNCRDAHHLRYLIFQDKHCTECICNTMFLFQWRGTICTLAF